MENEKLSDQRSGETRSVIQKRVEEAHQVQPKRLGVGTKHSSNDAGRGTIVQEKNDQSLRNYPRINRL
jgi:hypothetical protein